MSGIQVIIEWTEVKLEFELQGLSSIFAFCHTLLKMVILLRIEAEVRLILNTTSLMSIRFKFMLQKCILVAGGSRVRNKHL